jgi:hypothetical protein
VSDPKHPAKVVIVIRGGLVDAIFTDKKIDARFFIADYDAQEDGDDYRMVDHNDQIRSLVEDTAMLDTAAVRNIINKKGGKE